MAKGDKEFKKLNMIARQRIAKVEKKENEDINKQTKQERLF